MKSSLLGINISLFGIALIMVSSGTAVTIGFYISFVGLLVSLISWKYGKK
ncbi:hypothetical protein [Psychrobacillus sp. L4]